MGRAKRNPSFFRNQRLMGFAKRLNPSYGLFIVSTMAQCASLIVALRSVRVGGIRPRCWSERTLLSDMPCHQDFAVRWQMQRTAFL